MITALELSRSRWPEFSQVVFVPPTVVEDERLITFLDDFVDEVGNDEAHPLASLMKVVGSLVERYEGEQVSILESLSPTIGRVPLWRSISRLRPQLDLPGLREIRIVSPSVGGLL